jgi:hypothetical protein
MLECQSRQVPMKSKRTAFICSLGALGSVDIVLFVESRRSTRSRDYWASAIPLPRSALGINAQFRGRYSSSGAADPGWNCVRINQSIIGRFFTPDYSEFF